MLNRKATRRSVLQGLAKKRDALKALRLEKQAKRDEAQVRFDKAQIAYYESRATEEKEIDDLYTAWQRAHDEYLRAYAAFAEVTEDYLAALERHDRFAEAIVLCDVEGQVREMVETTP